MGQPASGGRRLRPSPTTLAIIAGVALAALLVIAWLRGWIQPLLQHEQLVEWMRRPGIAGPLICVGIQFLQVVAFAIPGEITQFAAGYVFGAGWGVLYSIIGILFGSAVDFGIAKAVGRPMIKKMVGAEKLSGIDESMQSRKGHLAIFALFLLPGAPKDAMCYAAGLTVPARMPALLMSTTFGAQAYDRDFAAMIWLALAVAIVIAATGYYRRGRRGQ